MTNRQPDAPAARDAPIAMDAKEFREIGHRLVDDLADLLGGIAERPVARGEDPVAIREVLDAAASLPDEGIAAGPLLERATRLLIDHSLFNGHPRFFGYITAPAAPIGVLGDFLASAINANMGAWVLSPMASEIEGQTVRWISELIGYPSDCGGLLVSGGNVANFVCFYAARAAKAGVGIREAGTAEAGALRVYGSAETHTWIQKAADLSGMGTDAIRWVPTDGDQRMRVDELRCQVEEDLANGYKPFMVVGTGGSVSTGAIDPLPEIAACCREYDLWFHVDGAYGGFAAAVPESPDDLKALAEADSVAVDPHKWLYAPLEAGCALVRDPQHLRDAFSYHPPYYHFGVEATNYVDFGLQNSRGFRALKVWLALQQVGRTGYVTMMRDDIGLAQKVYMLAEEHPDLDAITTNLSITTFRYVPSDLRGREAESEVGEHLNALNKEIQLRMESEGEAFVSNAIIDGCYVLRACIVNFRTDREDVEALIPIIIRLGEAADGELRPAQLAIP